MKTERNDGEDAGRMATQLASAVQVIAILGEVIRTAKEIPSGHLYAMVCGSIDLNSYEHAIRLLKRAGLVTERTHLFTWVGPEIAR